MSSCCGGACLGGVEVGDGHVEGEVDAGFVVGFGEPGGEGFGHGVALGLEGEVDDGGGASDGRGLCAGGVVVSGCGTAEGHVEVGVDVDATGEDEEVGGVDEGVVGGVDVGGDAGDLFVLDEDVEFGRGFGGDNGAVFD